MRASDRNRGAAPADPRPAATLVVLRDGDEGVEVLLTRRPEHLRFMGGAVVFPGGALEPGDSDVRWSMVSRLTPEEASVRLGGDVDAPDALGFFVAALRESFEEVGFGGVSLGDLRVARQDARDPATFLAKCLAHDVVLDTDLLVPAGRWVTPLGAPVRFDTRFFITQAPEEWSPDPDPDEVAGCWWRSPHGALEDLGAGRSVMAPPTIEMLQRLEPYSSVQAALDSFVTSDSNTSGILSTRLSPLVHVVLAPNPGVMTGPGTNTYVVGGRGPHWVIDPAVSDPPYVDAVMDVAGAVDAILVTHRHSDHTGGVVALHSRTGAPVRAFGAREIEGAPVIPIADGEQLHSTSMQLRALHTPGHASDHICLYAPQVATLFSGDTILGEGTAVIAPPDGNMADYIASLQRLRELHIDRIYPGHFRAVDGGTAAIDAYLVHRAERARAVVDAVASGATELDDIVQKAYAGTPPELVPAASLSALAQLEMLEAAGTIRKAGRGWILDATDAPQGEQ